MLPKQYITGLSASIAAFNAILKLMRHIVFLARLLYSLRDNMDFFFFHRTEATMALAARSGRS